MFVNGVLLDETAFLTDDAPKDGEPGNLSTSLQARMAAHPEINDYYDTVVRECEWLREWAQNQQGAEVVYELISQE
jgi:hypothetical protein